MRLHVSKFSCIKEADLQFGTITLMIGPQASGKSVLCKLAYFCLDALRYDRRIPQDPVSFETFKNSLKRKFYEWFPLSAWGSQQFVIEFQAGQLELRFSRTVYKNKPQENIRIWASESVHEFFSEVAQFARTLSEKSKRKSDEWTGERSWRVSQFAAKSLARRMSPDATSSQVFVPAGRSFFTSIGKAVAAFEQGRVLDPLTLNFGRLYAQLREHRSMYMGRSAPATRRVIETMNSIFGGELKITSEAEFVLTSDGRHVPISALSSGQQELLPLITVLPFLRAWRDEIGAALVYIEEPEAHLFPEAQGRLVEALSYLVNSSRRGLGMVLTTHSPYVLAKCNNLMKAGQLSKKFSHDEKMADMLARLGKIVAQTLQIAEGQVRAYAIIDGVLTSIVTDDGLINADYLDSVSSQLSAEFSELLKLEYAERS